MYIAGFRKNSQVSSVYGAVKIATTFKITLVHVPLIASYNCKPLNSFTIAIGAVIGIVFVIAVNVTMVLLCLYYHKAWKPNINMHLFLKEWHLMDTEMNAMLRLICTM